jgi:hypothetical protein
MTMKIWMLPVFVLAGCASGEAPSPAAAPAEASAPAAAPAPMAAAAAPAEATPGLPAPDFRLAGLDGTTVSLGEALADAGGAPTVLVLGSATCSYSVREVNDLAAAAPAYRVLAVVAGEPSEVKASLPAKVPFRVLVDTDGATLGKYRVGATPSVVVLDGKGAVAFMGSGGYMDPKDVAGLAAKVAAGTSVDPSTIKTQGG